MTDRGDKFAVEETEKYCRRLDTRLKKTIGDIQKLSQEIRPSDVEVQLKFLDATFAEFIDTMTKLTELLNDDDVSRLAAWKNDTDNPVFEAKFQASEWMKEANVTNFATRGRGYTCSYSGSEQSMSHHSSRHSPTAE